MTTDLPRQIDRRLRGAIKQLPPPWSLVTKRDHYFVNTHDGQRLCVGNNGNKPDEHLTVITLRKLKKIMEAHSGNGQ